MQQVNVLKVNGVALTEVKTIAINPENIVTTKSDANGYCVAAYAEVIDRRTKPKVLTIATTKATVDAYITGDVHDLTVYDLVSGNTSTLTLQEKFVREMKESKAVVAGTLTACREVKYVDGGFVTKTVYVSNTLVSMAAAAAAITTTTTA